MVYYYNRWRETSKVGTSPYFYAADVSLNSFKVNRLEGFPTVCYSLMVGRWLCSAQLPPLVAKGVHHGDTRHRLHSSGNSIK